MADITFDIPAFRLAFPSYASVATYPDTTLQGWWDAATCYISSGNYGYLNGNCRARAINLMTAHLIYLQGVIAGGEQVGFTTSATIDKISVAMAEPPSSNAWQYWLNTSPYGMQLLALLSMKGVGGMYIGGLPERDAFRKVYGVF